MNKFGTLVAIGLAMSTLSLTGSMPVSSPSFSAMESGIVKSMVSVSPIENQDTVVDIYSQADWDNMLQTTVINGVYVGTGNLFINLHCDIVSSCGALYAPNINAPVDGIEGRGFVKVSSEEGCSLTVTSGALSVGPDRVIEDAGAGTWKDGTSFIFDNVDLHTTLLLSSDCAGLYLNDLNIEGCSSSHDGYVVSNQMSFNGTEYQGRLQTMECNNVNFSVKENIVAEDTSNDFIHLTKLADADTCDLTFSGCDFVFPDKGSFSGVSVKMSSIGSITFSNTDFNSEGKSTMKYGTEFYGNQVYGHLTVTGVTVNGATEAGLQFSSTYPHYSSQDSTPWKITGTEGKNLIQNCKTGIDCSMMSMNYGLEIKDYEIKNCGTGITFLNSNGKYLRLTNLNVLASDMGFNMEHVPKDTVVKDTTITGTDKKDSVGVRSYIDNYTVADDLVSDKDCVLERVTIQNFDTGIYNYSTSITVGESVIKNVNSGHRSGTGCLLVRNSEFIANESVAADDFIGESYGIEANTTGVKAVNTKVSGFRIGMYSRYASSGVVNCELNNIDLNAQLQCVAYYNCLFENAKINVKSQTYIRMLNCELQAKRDDNYTGIYMQSTDSHYNILGLSKDDALEYMESTPEYSSMTYVINMARYMYEKDESAITRPMEIRNEGVGILTLNSGSANEIRNMKVYNCNTGLSNGLYRIDDCEIYDCNEGINASTIFMINNDGTLNVHDCNGTGITLSQFINGDTACMISVSDCQDGMKLTNNFSAGTSFRLFIHDNKNDGLILDSGVSLITGPFTAYNNGNYNVDMIGPVKQFLLTTNGGYDSKLENGGKGNMHIDISADSYSGFQFSAHELYSDDGIFEVTGENQIKLYPQPVRTDWLHGNMTFALPEYRDGYQIAMYSGPKMDSIYARSHFFTNKEGWIVKPVYNETQSSETNSIIQLNAAEGCIVTYDYKTNGGDSFSEDFERLTYEKNTDVDLSYTASKDGYEFVGWSLTPNGTEVVDSVTAETSNITLYAVFRKELQVNHITYSSATDKTETGYIFNKDDTVYSDDQGKHGMMVPALSKKDGYQCVGYTYDADSYANMITDATISGIEDIDLYYVYLMSGKITYKADDQIVDTDAVSYHKIGHAAENTVYTYTLRNYASMNHGYRFVGWRDAGNGLHLSGQIYETINPDVILTADEEKILAESLIVNPKEANLIVGDTIMLHADVKPDTVFDDSVKWESEDATIATVSKNGKVKAVGVGTVKVWAYTQDGSQLSDYAVIIVTEKKHDDVTTTEETTTTTEASSASTSDATESSPDTSTEATTEVTVNHPITGDTTKIGIATVMLLIAGAGVMILAKKRK